MFSSIPYFIYRNKNDMKYLKLFENFSITEEQIQKWLNENCDTNWFDRQLEDRVDDYITEEEAEDYDGDQVEAYKNLATGGAVEYDLLAEMNKMICDEFSIPNEYAYDKKIEPRSVSDICHGHLIDNCSWYDKYVFNRRSTEPYKNSFGFGNIGDYWKDSDNIDGRIKL